MELAGLVSPFKHLFCPSHIFFYPSNLRLLPSLPAMTEPPRGQLQSFLSLGHQRYLYEHAVEVKINIEPICIKSSHLFSLDLQIQLPVPSSMALSKSSWISMNSSSRQGKVSGTALTCKRLRACSKSVCGTTADIALFVVGAIVTGALYKISHGQNAGHLLSSSRILQTYFALLGIDTLSLGFRFLVVVVTGFLFAGGFLFLVTSSSSSLFWSE
jgi:hypothetical protein